MTDEVDVDHGRCAVALPDLGMEGEPIQVSAWFVEVGDQVEAGDRIVELTIRGLSFDLPAPAEGRIAQIAKGLDAAVSQGDVLGWIDASVKYEN